ncbi:transmembrane 9 superfamily member 1 [Erythrolamprus reginae]|uniref:transmembrane 9 superfamily member 1 n=1 Tax=Erythrolamprus reginae TaxID=121349 RepID=UPI00396C6B2D
MSGLGKLFGKGKKAKAPTPQEAIQKLHETETILVKKQEFLEEKIQQELQSAKKHGTKNKRAALQALKRKKRYEQQLAQIDGTLSTIEFQREALENATTNTEVLKTMSDAARAMKEAHQHMDIDKVDDLMAEITEQQDIAQQISDAISKPVGFGDDVDEDELLAELEEMEQEELDKDLLNVGKTSPELPNVPASRLPSVPASKVPSVSLDDDEDEEMKQLAAWVSYGLITPVLRVRLAAFFLSGTKVRDLDLVLGVALLLPGSGVRGPQMASRAFNSEVGFSAKNFSTQATFRISRMFSRFEAGRKMQVGHYQGVKDDAHTPCVGEEGVVGQAQQDLRAGVGEAAAPYWSITETYGVEVECSTMAESSFTGEGFLLVARSRLWGDFGGGEGPTTEEGGTDDVLGKGRLQLPQPGTASWCGHREHRRIRLRAEANDRQTWPRSCPRRSPEGPRRLGSPRLGSVADPSFALQDRAAKQSFAFLSFLFLKRLQGSSGGARGSPRGAAFTPPALFSPNSSPAMAPYPFLALLVAFLHSPGVAPSETHYQQGSKVMLYVNKVGPYHNPQETYHYYQLPVCSPTPIRHKSLTLGEVLDGDRMAESMYEIHFRQNVEKKILCQKKLSPDEVERLRQAIEELYYFEFVVDDLPLRGFVGYMEESGFLPHTHKIGLWTHLDFYLEWNGDRIVYANVSVRNVKPTSLDDIQGVLPIAYTYSVHWSETSAERQGERRGSHSGDDGFFPHTLEIHWLSIINSMVLVFLLVGFVVVILMRVLKNDLARYNLDEEASSSSSGDDFDQGDNGWKIIHTDVFRFPPYRSLLCAILGVGSQFLALATGIIVMALLGMFNVHRHGAINSAAILLYALTCCISGYVSSNFYRQIGGERWVWNIVLTTSLFSAPFFLTWSVVNSVHWANGSTQALPVTTIFLLLTVWLLVGFPLTVIGGIFGKNRATPFDAPCRTKNIAREIPPQPWYKCTVVHMTIGGFLPFSAISVELYYIFATVWGREQYTLYGILFFVFAILLSVGACISIALTYFQLSGEDYRWWWRSILSAGSTGLFIFLYSVFYYTRRSNMSGMVQTVEFFGYSLLTGFVFFLMLGTISFFASLKFIRYIYVNLKMD